LDICVREKGFGFGTPIHATHDGTVEKIFYDIPHRTRGNGLYLLSDDKSFSTVYWHLSQFSDNVRIGHKITQGQVIGLMGNSGFVRPLPTQDKPRNGTHLHFAKKVHGLHNDYNGFVDPVIHMIVIGEKLPIYFARDLFIGRSGDDCSWLQTCLKLEGFAEDYEPIGFFGNKTMRDVRLFQKKYNIKPAIGYFGPKTRKQMMSLWSCYSS